MPSTITVKVSNIGSTTRGDFNMVEIKGVDCESGKSVTKTCFETTKSGDLTKNAQVAENLSNGDFVEMVLDDSSYKNLKTIKKVGAPAGGVASGPAKSSGSNGGGGNNSDRMTKAEWAEKDRKTEASMARHGAMKAVSLLFSTEKITGSIVKSMEKLAYRIEAYLLTGDFDGEVPAVVVNVAQPDNTVDQGNVGDNDDVTDPEDDDIPF